MTLRIHVSELGLDARTQRNELASLGDFVFPLDVDTLMLGQLLRQAIAAGWHGNTTTLRIDVDEL